MARAMTSGSCQLGSAAPIRLERLSVAPSCCARLERRVLSALGRGFSAAGEACGVGGDIAFQVRPARRMTLRRPTVDLLRVTVARAITGCDARFDGLGDCDRCQIAAFPCQSLKIQARRSSAPCHVRSLQRRCSLGPAHSRMWDFPGSAPLLGYVQARLMIRAPAR